MAPFTVAQMNKFSRCSKNRHRWQNVRAYVEERIAKKEKIMGVGHRVYTTKDPRAVVLQDLAANLFRSETGKNKPR